MKRFSAVILILICVLILTSCGGNSLDKSTPKPLEDYISYCHGINELIKDVDFTEGKIKDGSIVLFRNDTEISNQEYEGFDAAFGIKCICKEDTDNNIVTFELKKAIDGNDAITIVNVDTNLLMEELEEGIKRNIVTAEKEHSDKYYNIYCRVKKIEQDHVLLDTGNDYIDFKAFFSEEDVECLETDMYINIFGRISSLNERDEEHDSIQTQYYAELDKVIYIDNITHLTGPIRELNTISLELYPRERWGYVKIPFDSTCDWENRLKTFRNNYLNFCYFSFDDEYFFKDDVIEIECIMYGGSVKSILKISYLHDSGETSHRKLFDNYTEKINNYYNEAIEYMNNKEYSEALWRFRFVGDYLDAQEKSAEILEIILDKEKETDLSKMQGYWHQRKEDSCVLLWIDGKNVYKKPHINDFYHENHMYVCELDNNVLSYNATYKNIGPFQLKLSDNKVIFTIYNEDGSVHTTEEYYHTDDESSIY